MPIYLGIDLGGTNIKAGVVDVAGKVLAHASIPTGAGVDQVVANMGHAAREALRLTGRSLEEVAAVGIDAPGAVDDVRGIVVQAPNIPGFKNIPLRDIAAQAMGKPTVLENDAKAAAYGEFWAGAGRTAKVHSMVMITLGTGVGGGVILDGKILHGRDNIAGEIGHMIVVPDGTACPCGQHGCLERYSSASRTGARAVERLGQSAEASSLRAVLASTGKITSLDVETHARAGDAVALEVWDLTCRYLGIACINIMHMFDPELIVLAGGMAQAGEFLRGRVDKYVQEMYWRMTPLRTALAIAELGNDMGVIGAAGLAHAEVTGIAKRLGKQPG